MNPPGSDVTFAFTVMSTNPYGSFTLPDTETDTDKMCTKPMEICMGLV